MCECNPDIRSPYCSKCIPKPKHEDLFIYFDGEETEKEFLQKCMEQWTKTNNAKSETQKLMVLGSLFAEIRNRLKELDD